jgi:putative resolvase
MRADPPAGRAAYRVRMRLVSEGNIGTLLEYQERRVEAIFRSDRDDGLVDDVVAVITSLAARIYGHRHSKHGVFPGGMKR